MDGTTQDQEVQIGAASLEVLMPMHVVLGSTGHVTGFGPTLAKLFPGTRLIGRQFFDLFEVRRPFKITTMAGLRAVAGRRVYLSLREPGSVVLRGVAMPLVEGQGMLMNLSFGVGVIDAVRTHALTDADFTPTDLTMEMLFLVEVNAAVTGELRQLNLRLRGAKVEAEEQALTDTLTGLRNRRGLDQALAILAQTGQPFSLMHIDLDYFKAVNDTFGHLAGDEVLRAVGRVLVEETRVGDTVARVGGDEFLLAFPGALETETLSVIAERIISRIQQPVDYDGQSCCISASIGIALSRDYPWLDLERMLGDVDAALYASKRGGRGRATLSEPQQAET